MSKTCDPRRGFLSGAAPSYTVGGDGATVHAEVVDGVVRVRTTMPRRRQKSLGPDAPKLRRLAAEAAELTHEKVRASAAGQVPDDGLGEGLIRVGDVWRRYLNDKLSGLPAGVLSLRKCALRELYEKMTPEARRLAPSLDSIYIVLQAARRMDRTGAAPLRRVLSTLEPGDFNRHAREIAARGHSPHTAATDIGRWKTAIRHCRRSWPRWWGTHGTPEEGIASVSTAHIKPSEIEEDKAVALIAALLRGGNWRAYATAVIVSESGRRVGAVGAYRDGLHLDGPPLCANDFVEGEDGVLYVTWRAAAAKGGNFGRGDETLPCTQALEAVFRLLCRDHPNPTGPEHPLVWSPEKPTRGVSYRALTDAFGAAWVEVFASPRPSGVAWHALIRGLVTTVADELGEIAAGEYSGRSPEVVLRRYKRVRPERQQATVHALDQLRGRGERAPALILTGGELGPVTLLTARDLKP